MEEEIVNNYESYRKTFIWKVLTSEIKTLEINQDLQIATTPHYVIGSLVKGLVTNSVLIEKLAETFWKIHSHSLYPYYSNKKEYEESWDELAEHQVDSDEVSKEFFRNIARHVLTEQ